MPVRRARSRSEICIRPWSREKLVTPPANATISPSATKSSQTSRPSASSSSG